MKSRRNGRPPHGRSANGLAQIYANSAPFIVPAYALIHESWIINDVGHRQSASCFQANDIDTSLRKLISYRTAAGPRADNNYN
jgi:hypothetical protein